jgi:hypothetical protein
LIYVFGVVLHGYAPAVLVCVGCFDMCHVSVCLFLLAAGIHEIIHFSGCGSGDTLQIATQSCFPSMFSQLANSIVSCRFGDSIWIALVPVLLSPFGFTEK